MRNVGATIQLRMAKSALFAVVLLFSLAGCSAGQASGSFSIDESPLPPATGFVNDFAGVIDEATKSQLEEKLKNLRDTTNPSVELAVAVVRTTGDRPISDYSLAVARGWKIGSREDDNPSALLFVAVDDRRYFTQISRNLEDELPDALVGSLQRRYLVPEFRQGNYGKGISDTVDAYIARIRDSGNAAVPANTDAREVPPKKGIIGGGIGEIACCIGVGLILLMIVIGRLGRRKSSYHRNHWGGGGFGGSALPWIIGGMLSGGGNSSGWGGSSDWGGSSGGGSDWGGFGGGGDFGGGGAGGDW